MAFVYLLWNIQFQDLPKLYLAGLTLLLSVPCLIIWCICLLSAWRYERKDLELVSKQRLERAQEVTRSYNEAAASGGERSAQKLLVDCSEAQMSQDLIYTA